MVAATPSADLAIGLILGFLLGLLIGPLIRSWLSWREWTSASREADLVGDVLNRMDAGFRPVPEDPGADDGLVPDRRRDAS